MCTVRPVQIKVRRVGARRTRVLRRMRPVYEIEIIDGERLVFRDLTITPLSILDSKGHVHPIDSYDWTAAADRVHASGSDGWVTDPFKHTS